MLSQELVARDKSFDELSELRVLWIMLARVYSIGDERVQVLAPHPDNHVGSPTAMPEHFSLILSPEVFFLEPAVFNLDPLVEESLELLNVLFKWALPVGYDKHLQVSFAKSSSFQEVYRNLDFRPIRERSIPGDFDIREMVVLERESDTSREEVLVNACDALPIDILAFVLYLAERIEQLFSIPARKKVLINELDNVAIDLGYLHKLMWPRVAVRAILRAAFADLRDQVFILVRLAAVIHFFKGLPINPAHSFRIMRSLACVSPADSVNDNLMVGVEEFLHRSNLFSPTYVPGVEHVDDDEHPVSEDLLELEMHR